jgi:hypothetical protein
MNSKYILIFLAACLCVVTVTTPVHAQSCGDEVPWASIVVFQPNVYQSPYEVTYSLAPFLNQSVVVYGYFWPINSWALMIPVDGRSLLLPCQP